MYNVNKTRIVNTVNNKLLNFAQLTYYYNYYY